MTAEDERFARALKEAFKQLADARREISQKFFPDLHEKLRSAQEQIAKAMPE